jgi:hypothetical protein
MRPPIPEQPYTYLFRGALGGVAVGSPVLLNGLISLCSAVVSIG